MKSKDIKELQNRLFDYLEPYFVTKGFKMDRKEWNIYNSNHIINLYVNTTHYDYYTLRPGLTILYNSFFSEIQKIVKNDDFQIFNNGHFDLFQKLANVFGIHNFDECEENNFNKFNVCFTISVDQQNISTVANRLIEIIESFGWKTIASTSNLDSLYHFYKKILLLFFDVYENDPTRRATQYPLALDINGYLTLIYLGLEKGDNEIFNIIERYNKIQNNHAYFVNPVQKLIVYFNYHKK